VPWRDLLERFLNWDSECIFYAASPFEEKETAMNFVRACEGGPDHRGPPRTTIPTRPKRSVGAHPGRPPLASRRAAEARTAGPPLLPRHMRRGSGSGSALPRLRVRVRPFMGLFSGRKCLGLATVVFSFYLVIYV
jgi:hypothetical protein